MGLGCPRCGSLITNQHELECGTESLKEFDETEWRDVAKRLRPDWSEDDFQKAWLEFSEWKRTRFLA